MNLPKINVHHIFQALNRNESRGQLHQNCFVFLIRLFKNIHQNWSILNIIPYVTFIFKHDNINLIRFIKLLKIVIQFILHNLEISNMYLYIEIKGVFLIWFCRHWNFSFSLLSYMPTFPMYNRDRFYALQNANPDQDSKYQPKKKDFVKIQPNLQKWPPDFQLKFKITH